MDKLVKNHISRRTSFRSVVPGLSSSSFSNFPSSTSMTPSRQEIDHAKSSSSSSTSSTTTVSSDSENMLNGKNGETRFPSPPKIQNQIKTKTTIQNGETRFVSDIPEWLDSEILEWLQEITENLVDDSVPEHRDSHASSSHEPSLEPTPARKCGFG